MTSIVEVALPIPKRALFDYLLPEQMSVSEGCRVLVPFGRRQLVGVVIGTKAETDYELSKLKPIAETLDATSVFSESLFQLLRWAGRYYQHPIGEVMNTALPVHLRQGGNSQPLPQGFWQLCEDADKAKIKSSASKQLALLEKLAAGKVAEAELKPTFSGQVLTALEKKGIIERLEILPELADNWQQQIKIAEKPTANIEQSLAITQLQQHQQQFYPALLEGVTGSGKTEVYLQAIEPVLAKGQQVLILVPEIGLTPQTVARFEQRFGIEVGMLHSALTDNERFNVWRRAKAGELGIVIGTRSAIFTPLAKPGMLIIDEEHDNSFKQQDGFRYHARDLAVYRARLESIPLLLGTATPSLESLNNALNGKYQHFQLQQRAGHATLNKQSILDIKSQPLEAGIAKGIRERMQQHLQQGNQVMVFLNRRGYAPALICHQCGFVEHCHRCNSSYTLHRQLRKLQCHHCGDAQPIPRQCQQCGSDDLTPQGVGTEQLEQSLQKLFPGYATARIDSDSTRGKYRLPRLLNEINQGKYQLLIGTQILAKGHHFADVTLVVVLDVDGALFSADFRAAENLAQLITQVSGRAGRANKPGEMWLQSHQPDHPLLQDLLNNGYGHFARLALQERKAAHLPPYQYQALIRSESHHSGQAFQFLLDASRQVNNPQVWCVGPMPAIMEKRQGRHRMQLLLQSPQRAELQKQLSQLLFYLESAPLASKVRWSVDVDPQDFT